MILLSAELIINEAMIVNIADFLLKPIANEIIPIANATDPESAAPIRIVDQLNKSSLSLNNET